MNEIRVNNSEMSMRCITKLDPRESSRRTVLTVFSIHGSRSPARKTFKKKNRMIYSIKSNRLVKKCETSGLLMTHSFGDMVIKSNWIKKRSIDFIVRACEWVWVSVSQFILDMLWSPTMIVTRCATVNLSIHSISLLILYTEMSSL